MGGSGRCTRVRYGVKRCGEGFDGVRRREGRGGKTLGRKLADCDRGLVAARRKVRDGCSRSSWSWERVCDWLNRLECVCGMLNGLDGLE